ncbi:MAG TPA: helix-turn-helix transcriptional regulator [Terracidiphilus sp.]|nr:helix-turn-helix transcriptional regulator [Terracidiphilus sp.]
MSVANVRTAAFVPGPALRPYVRRFLVVENLGDRTNTLLPDTAIIAGFRFRGACSRNGAEALRAVVTGLRDLPRTLTHAAGSGTILAMFTATGAAAFVCEPLEELFNGTMPIDAQVRRSRLELIEEQLAEAPDHARRAQALERFLLDHLRRWEPSAAVSTAVARIQDAKGSLRIGELARVTGLSQSALERRFRREVGASPKKFAAIVRLRHVVRLRRAGTNLTDIAHAAGYADQSHFIKDFRRFSGQSPEAFFSSEPTYC